MVDILLTRVEDKINQLEEGKHKLVYSRGYKEKKYQDVYSVQVSYNDVCIINRQISIDKLTPYSEDFYNHLDVEVMEEIMMYAFFGEENMVNQSNRLKEVKSNDRLRIKK